MKSKLTFFFPLLLFIAAFIFRWGHVKNLTEYSWYFENLLSDSYVYVLNAFLIKTGKIADITITYPGFIYPGFIALILKLFKDNLFFVVFLQIILSSFSVLLVYLSAKKMYGFIQGGIAGLISAIAPLWIHFDALILKPSLIMFFVSLYFFLFLKRREFKKNIYFIILSSFLIGMLCLLRGNFLIWVPVHLLMILTLPGKKVTQSVSSLLMILLLLSPLTIYNYIKYQDFILTYSQAGINAYIGNNSDNITGYYMPPAFMRPSGFFEEADFKNRAEELTGRKLKPSEVSKFWMREAGKFIKDQPGKFFVNFFRKIKNYFDYYEVPDNYDFQVMRKLSYLHFLKWLDFPLLFSLALVGIVFSRNENHIWLVAYAGIYIFSVVAFFVFSRFKVVTMPLIIILSSNGIVDIALVLYKREIGKIAKRVSFLLLVFLLLIWNPYRLKVDEKAMWININKFSDQLKTK